MKIIIDTSAKKMKLILLDGSNILLGTEFEGNHSENLLKEIEKLLLSSGKTIQDISLVALVAGPGSFTGIRLSVATAKALSLVINAKYIAINKLELLDFALKSRNIIDGNYIIATYCTSSKSYVMKSIIDEKKCLTMTNEEIVNLIRSEHVSIYSPDLWSDSFDNAEVNHFPLSNEDYIEYISLIERQGGYSLPKDIQPIYMAVSQAEEELIKRESK